MNNRKRVIVVIPARYGSSRLPGKPLVDICGKPMIQHVYEKALLISLADKVIVATDDKRVFEAVKSFGGDCIMTSVAHKSGTDRLVEVSLKEDADIYVNLQGDEPLFSPADIDLLISKSSDRGGINTLCHIIDRAQALEVDRVKVVFSRSYRALYFSRSLIPYYIASDSSAYYGHVGVYLYDKSSLDLFSKLQPSPLEEAESLEQLRLLYSDIPVHVCIIDAKHPVVGVDTLKDLAFVREYMRNV